MAVLNQFKGEQAVSLGPKSSIIAWYLTAVALASWLAFVATPVQARGGDSGRQVALLLCALVYVARAAHTLFAFVRRKVPWWEAAWGGGIIGCVLFAYLTGGLRVTIPLGARDAAALLLYAAGSFIGTASEWTRHRWKLRPENRGHLYTGGLFAYARHINYFGDVLLFTGFALLTRLPWAGYVPLGMTLNFIFVIIPAHDAYLAARYGGEFRDYASRTKRLVPFVY